MSKPTEKKHMQNLENRQKLFERPSAKIGTTEIGGSGSACLVDPDPDPEDYCSSRFFKKMKPDELVALLKNFGDFLTSNAKSIVDETDSKTFVDVLDSAVDSFELR
jgi:hypothetical protein